MPLNAQLRMGWISILGIIRQGTLSALFIGLVLLNAGLIAFFWASVVTGVVLVAVTVALIRGHRAAAARPSMPSRGSGSCGTRCPTRWPRRSGLVYFRIAVVLMSYVATDEETGIFSAAFRIVEVVGVLPWLLVSAAFPILARAARDDEARLGYALQKIFEVAVVLGVFIALGLAVAAPFAIKVVAGPDFTESVPVLRLQAVGLVTSFLMITWTYALLSLKLFRPLLLANAAAAVVAIVATLALSPPFGAEGAAIATVLAEAVLAAASLTALRRHRPALSPRLRGGAQGGRRARRRRGRRAARAGAGRWSLSLLAGAVYGGVALLLGAVPAEAINALRRRALGCPA